MSAVEAAPSASPAGPVDGAQRRRRPRPRNHHGQTQAAGQDTGAAERPQQQPRAARGARGGARGGTLGQRGGSSRGRGGAGQHPVAPRTVGGRQFGGQLTEEHTTADPRESYPESSELQADAPVFQPGKPVPARKPRPPRERKPRAPKSTAADIATRTHEDIDNGHYECAICTEEVKRFSRAWSCRTCWTVFHLSCVKKWSANEGSAATRQQVQDGELPPPRQWRCPGCNLPKDHLPSAFTCWCEKEQDPKPLPGLPPFSCGQTCARPRFPKKCPHPCPSTCHAGPCSPCGQMGPTQYCFCGKKSVTRRCIDTNYETGWSCGDICGELMPCGEHACSRPCHEGLCGSCEARVPARCYCGQVQKDLLCCDRGDETESQQSHPGTDGSVNLESWTGLFECTNTCHRLFDCVEHRCEKPCHPQDAEPSHCPRSPDVVDHCPCGKTALKDLLDNAREACTDAIPNCSMACGNLLGCGHKCKQPCHQGVCPPCLQMMKISCKCGRTTSPTVCHQGLEEPPQCMRVCRVSLNCGRHECGERCCPGERKASERQSVRRKPRPLTSAPHQRDDGYEAEHICLRSCGRQLRCGNPDHRCQELCHKGPCGSCREAIFDEVSCDCGRTVLQPPLPCGTKPPPCRYQCERRKNCGHPQVPHNCHQDDETCPKCPFLTTKPCLCGKNSLKNQPCWLMEVRCGEICGRRLKCGAHQCQNQCHRPGECSEPCRQTCGKELSICQHPCMAPCHSPVSCKEDKLCQQKVFITCECQRIKQEVRCNTSKTSNGNLGKSLKCDDECARLERNHKLALALKVDPNSHQSDHVPYTTETLSMYQENPTWATAQEKVLRLFAANPDERRLRFKPMPAHQRAFLHSVAEDFGFDTESMDPEPHRHVSIFKTPRFVMAPMRTLAECARTRPSQRVVPTTSKLTARTKPNTISRDPFNAFIITNPRFALTIEEVHTVMKSALRKTSFPLVFEIEFLPTEEVALKPPLAARVSIPERELEAMLESVKPTLTQECEAHTLGKIQLARLDSSLNVQRKELAPDAGAGWSQVVAKGAPARKVEVAKALGSKGGFAVLSLSNTKKQKEKEKVVEVADHWEAAESMEEERERADEAVD
ncbi:hypothetical protein BDV95DRAFT_561255 [Massariosphaeria phaeospora]|uniref:R3H domain-containing protein n=1 Tax=Massariosphaeria phaeospora TaxID=100035 RepID=A0A7C8MIY9_9PLEO|nr:hypothetical protein BDV95DRAFT_561255 [Massariosphaeria phaeospora]